MAEVNDASQKRKSKPGVLAILMVGAIVLLAIVILWPQVKRRRRSASRVVFGTNMSGIAKSLKVYINDDEHGRLPPVDKWCDFLVKYDYCSPKQFIRNRSDALVGESHVAMNKYVAGKELAQFEPDVVLLFETDFGRDPAGRNEPVGDRRYHQTFPCPDPDRKVYKYRWNQVGGPEILTTKYTKGAGCNVVFVDGRVKWVKAADLPKLKWKPEPNDFDRVYRSYFLAEPNSR
ncbi:MAG: hypothetical protein ACYSTF_03875 [Planctomycetota bacterium]|jgi:prepilin-type processing-associated H-X9-DG protein